MTTLRDAHAAVRPGDVLGGKFRIERVLGEGGMGMVAAATHLTLGQVVAIKFMLPAAMAYPENVARFEREARAAVRLKSDHVAKVTDVGRLDNGAPYIVMEYLEGEDLDVILDRGRLPVDTAVDYMLQTCEAVNEAHALGIVHRDLKPKNLFLTRRLSGKPLVKVLDFGISKSQGEDLSLTSTTQSLGSPNYMSPEQLRCARDVDHRTDIWALGCIMHELLTGQVPFVADTVTGLTAKVLEDQPSRASDLRPDVPPALADAIARCLEKDPKNRFPNVLEFAAAIAPFASHDGLVKAQELLSAPIPSARSSSERLGQPEPTSVRIQGPNSSTNSAWDRTQLATNPRSKRTIFIVSGLAAVALASVIAFAAVRHHQHGPLVATTTVAATITPSTVTPGPTETLATPATTTLPNATQGVHTEKPMVPSVPTTVRFNPTTKPDAGAKPSVSAPASTQVPTPPTTFQLPNVRN